jgi:anti-anti-sigma factor
MTGPQPFEIQEHRTEGWLWLSLIGELDRFSTPLLENRLASLRATRSPVTLDLSRLDFIDSTGIHLLIQTIGDARMKHWRFRIDRDISPPVMRLLKLVHLDQFALN